MTDQLEQISGLLTDPQGMALQDDWREALARLGSMPTILSSVLVNDA